MRSAIAKTSIGWTRGASLRTLVGIAILATPTGAIASQSCSVDTVSRQALGEAMRKARQAGGDYSLLATTNSMRFQSIVFERLIERALERRPEGGTLIIPYDILWWEFLAVANLGPGEEDKASVGRRLAFEYQQSIEVEYGPPSAIIKRISREPTPRIAANVRLMWPDRADRVRKFSFVDTLSVPRLQVTNYQLMSFRFLVFSDMTVLDEIDGISGRPLTGFLATLFKLIGEGGAVYARFSISGDGLQVLRAKSKRVVSKTVTVTIHPDGRVENGVPDGRPDLAEIEARLQQPLDIDYYPYRCPASPD